MHTKKEHNEVLQCYSLQTDIQKNNKQADRQQQTRDLKQYAPPHPTPKILLSGGIKREKILYKDF